MFVIITFWALLPVVVAAEAEPDITIAAFEVPVAIVPTFILFLLMVIFYLLVLLSLEVFLLSF